MWLLVIFQIYHGENKLIYYDIRMLVLYYTNMLSQIFKALTNSLNQQYLHVGRYVDRLEHIIVIASQPVGAIAP